MPIFHKPRPAPVSIGARRRNLSMAAHHFERFMNALGLDSTDEHLQSTPQRVARMFHDELFDNAPFAFTTFAAESQDMVIVKDIAFTSICAHHFVPFMGKAHIAYIPDERVAGLSKLARAVDFAARRPQVQERLVNQVADLLCEKLAPLGCGVVLEAEHLCMSIRGVQKVGATTVTSAMRGALLDDASARNEFLALVSKG